jgi:PTH1 family peptidyl-tRNA hydrolase
MALDRLAASIDARFTRTRAEALITDGALEGHKAILAKPQTYMNLVGRSVAALVRFYRIPLEHVLVICDDLDLPLGTIRMRPAGGSGGHKGLESIIERLGADAFPRLRLGIGRPPGRMDPADFVLLPFDVDEQPVVEATLGRAVDSARAFALEGIQAAMTHFNAAAE